MKFKNNTPVETAEVRPYKKELTYSINEIKDLGQWKAEQAAKDILWELTKKEKYLQAKARAIAILQGPKLDIKDIELKSDATKAREHTIAELTQRRNVVYEATKAKPVHKLSILEKVIIFIANINQKG